MRDFQALSVIHVIDNPARTDFLTFSPFLLFAKGPLVQTEGLALRLVFAGGAFGYPISPHGARTLLGFGERDGVQNAIGYSLMRNAEHLKVLQAIPQRITSRLASPGGSADSDIQYDFAPVPRPR